MTPFSHNNWPERKVFSWLLQGARRLRQRQKSKAYYACNHPAPGDEFGRTKGGLAQQRAKDSALCLLSSPFQTMTGFTFWAASAAVASETEPRPPCPPGPPTSQLAPSGLTHPGNRAALYTMVSADGKAGISVPVDLCANLWANFLARAFPLAYQSVTATFLPAAILPAHSLLSRPWRARGCTLGPPRRVRCALAPTPEQVTGHPADLWLACASWALAVWTWLWFRIGIGTLTRKRPSFDLLML